MLACPVHVLLCAAGKWDWDRYYSRLLVGECQHRGVSKHNST